MGAGWTFLHTQVANRLKTAEADAAAASDLAAAAPSPWVSAPPQREFAASSVNRVSLNNLGSTRALGGDLRQASEQPGNFPYYSPIFLMSSFRSSFYWIFQRCGPDCRLPENCYYILPDPRQMCMLNLKGILI